MMLINIDNVFVLFLIAALIFAGCVLLVITFLKRKVVPQNWLHNANYKTSFVWLHYLVKCFFYATGVTAVIVIALRPVSGIDRSSAQSSNLDIMLVFDTTLSMAANDVANSEHRLNAAQTAIVEVIERNRSYRYGVISYTQKTFVNIPVTSGLDSVILSIETLTPVDPGYAGGSDEAVAFQTAIKRLAAVKDAEQRSKVIIWITDGEILDQEEKEKLDDQIDKLKDSGIALITVGVGSVEGTTVPLFRDYTTGRYYGTSMFAGKNIESKADYDFLQNYANSAGGKHFALPKLAEIDDYLASLVGSTVASDDDVTVYNEMYYFFAPLALICFVLGRYLNIQRSNIKHHIK